MRAAPQPSSSRRVWRRSSGPTSREIAQRRRRKGPSGAGWSPRQCYAARDAGERRAVVESNAASAAACSRDHELGREVDQVGATAARVPSTVIRQLHGDDGRLALVAGLALISDGGDEGQPTGDKGEHRRPNAARPVPATLLLHGWYIARTEKAGRRCRLAKGRQKPPRTCASARVRQNCGESWAVPRRRHGTRQASGGQGQIR